MGKSIEYINSELKYRAIVEAMLDESEDTMQYYTVIFDVSVDKKTWPTVEPHEIFYDKNKAKSHLKDLMAKHIHQ